MVNNCDSPMTNYDLLFRKAKEMEPIIARANKIIRPIAPSLKKIQKMYQLSECARKQPLPLSSVVVEKEILDPITPYLNNMQEMVQTLEDVHEPPLPILSSRDVILNSLFESFVDDKNLQKNKILTILGIISSILGILGFFLCLIQSTH